VICADTSFLFSLYCPDPDTTAALKASEERAEPIAYTELNQFELENAIRCAVARRAITLTQAHERLASISADITAENLDPVVVNFAAVLREARRLSSRHSFEGGHRSYDILHVAAAVILRAKEFLSFDANQRKLGKAAGLKVGP
jgi:predicted nucleic acid-binding protein